MKEDMKLIAILVSTRHGYVFFFFWWIVSTNKYM